MAQAKVYEDYLDSCFDAIIRVERGQKIINKINHSIVVDLMYNQIIEIDRDIFLDRKRKKSKLINFKSEKIFPNSLMLSRDDLMKDNKSDNFDDILTDDPGEKKIKKKVPSKDDDRNHPPTSNKPIKSSDCIECGAIDSMIEDENHCCIVCSKCGCQREELLENGPEWHQYNNDDGRSEGVNRCGSTTSYYFPKSSQGTIITGFNHSRLNRKQKWNSTVYKEHSLNKDFDIITEVCSKNKISKMIMDTAKFFYKKISDCKHKSGKNIGKQYIIRGHNRDSVIGACIYKACETNHDPRTKREVANMIGKDEKRLSKGIKNFEKIMKNSDDDYVLENIHDGTPEDHIRKYCPKLAIKTSNIESAIKIANNCAKLKLATDHGAQSIGAGVTLLMANYFGLNIDKRDIAYWFKTSDVTVTKIYNKILPYVKALIDDDITEHIIKKFEVNG